MKTEIIKIKFPAFALPYIHNDDFDTITDQERILIDEYVKTNKILVVGIPKENDQAYFSTPPYGFERMLAGDYYDLDCLVSVDN